jgi:hypothetical protein
MQRLIAASICFTGRVTPRRRAVSAMTGERTPVG